MVLLSWQVDEGEFTDSEILVMLGENGTGKTTFIRMLAGMLKPDDHFCELPEYNVSYKPQKISPKFTSTVRNLLHKRIRDAYLHPTFINDVMKPMQVCTPSRFPILTHLINRVVGLPLYSLPSCPPPFSSPAHLSAVQFIVALVGVLTCAVR